jgi:hypothetical protein
MVCNYSNSAINVPTDSSIIQEVISTDSYVYVTGSGGDDTTGQLNSIDYPFATLTGALAFLDLYRIKKGKTVTIQIQKVDRSTTIWNDYQISGSEVSIAHAQASQIHIKGEVSSTLSLYGIGYYDTSLRAMGDSATGGYILEVLVGDIDDVRVGDFISIRDTSYDAGGVTGSTRKETDFNYEYAQGDGAGYTSDYGLLSLRKTLAFGCHEVIGFDSNNNGTKANSVLVHVRHYNPTTFSTTQDNPLGTDGTHSGGSGAGATAYITPQGLRYNTNSSLFKDNDTVGSIYGNIWVNGATGNRKTAGGGGLPTDGNSGDGATGNFGVTWVQDTTHGADGITWDTVYSPYRSDIEVRHYPCRLNFDSGSGIVVNGSALGSIQDLVVCGPGFAVGVSGGTAPEDSSNGINIQNSGSLNSSTNLCVVGFENGITTKRNSNADASGSIVSSCYNGILVEDSSNIIANSSIVSGCSTGYLIRESSTIEADDSISSSNFHNGVDIQKNSYGNFRRSLSCFNGGNGFSVSDSSTGKFHNHYKDDVYTWVGAGGTAAVEDERYGWSQRTGSYAFRNDVNGFYVSDSSSADVSDGRATYNGHSGVKITNSSSLKGLYFSSYRNGIASSPVEYTHPFGHNPAGPDGIYAERYSNAYVDYSRSVGNTGSGYQVLRGSYMDSDYSASRYNQFDGYKAFKDSTINVHGSTASNTSDGYTGHHADFDSQIYTDTQTSGTTLAANGSNVREE